MLVSWPLIGRGEELEFVERALATSAGVVLAGDAGVGKTRLAREALALAESRGFAAAWAVATEAARGIPLGALAHLFPEALPQALTRDDVILAAASALAPRSSEKRVVLAVDDAHLADDLTAVLLHHLAMSGRAFVIVSVRTGEATPDPIVGLWKDELCERLEVQALSEIEVRDLLERVFGAQFEGATTRRLWEQTRGNPLFLRELVLGGIESGALQEGGGVWRWKGELAASPRIRDVILTRLARLTGPEREALEIVAVGEPVSIRALESLASLDALEHLERLDLVTELEDGRRRTVRMSHPLYAQAVREAVPPVRVRTTSGLLADALQSAGARRREDLLRVASWELEAGRGGRADLLLPAALQALGLCDYVLAERLAHLSVDAGAGTPGTLVLSQSLMGQGRFNETEDLLARHEAEAATDMERAQISGARAQNLDWNLVEGKKAVQMLSDAEHALADADLRIELAAARAYLLFTAGRHDGSHRNRTRPAFGSSSL